MNLSKNIILFTSISILLLLSACSTNVPFTKSLIKEYGLESKHIKDLQFYIDSSIVLEREIENLDIGLTDSHTLKQIEDKYIDQIYFKKKTPCIVQQIIADTLYVTFEPNGYIKFKPHFENERYTIIYVPQKPQNSVNTDTNRTVFVRGGEAHKTGYLNYQNKIYDLYFRKGAPYLLVNEKKLRDVVIDSRTIKGMRH